MGVLRSECMQAWESMYSGERWSRGEGPKWSERSANRRVECLSVAKPDLLTDLDVSGGCEQGSDVSGCATRTAEMLRRAMAGARVVRRRAGCGGGRRRREGGGCGRVVVVESAGSTADRRHAPGCRKKGSDDQPSRAVAAHRHRRLPRACSRRR